jgi:hypothetical protein
MRYWSDKTPKNLIGSLIWNTSERYNIKLKSLAPRVFGWMIGCKKKRK